ncbi:MAG: hypothetical protein ACREOA_03060 [Candidatus Dormibacteria bacterium]
MKEIYLTFLRRRSTIVLASVAAAGAIAAIAIGASFAVFYDPPSPVTQTFQTGNVTLSNPSTITCTVSSLAPGYSTTGYPGNLGDQTGTPCSFTIQYTGTMPAFMATDVNVKATAGSDPDACGGGTAAGCEPLYSPNFNEETGLEVWSTYGNLSLTSSSNTSALGIGDDQTIANPGTTLVDTGYTGPAIHSPNTAAVCSSTTGANCPVNKGYILKYDTYVYWPLLSSMNQNIYQNANVTITLTVHAVQAYDNPLFSCPAISDHHQGSVSWGYAAPNQPQAGWGSGFSTSDGYPHVGKCPNINDTASDWVNTSDASTLYPFSHVEYTG